MTIFEVQRYGKTLEWTTSIKEALAAFKESGSGTLLFRIVGDNKSIVQEK